MDYTVAAVDEALGLLFLVAENPGLGVTELAKRSSNTKARAFRLLSTLEGRGFVQRHGDPAVYKLGHRTLLLGLAPALEHHVQRQRLAIAAEQRVGVAFHVEPGGLGRSEETRARLLVTLREVRRRVHHGRGWFSQASASRTHIVAPSGISSSLKS